MDRIRFLSVALLLSTTAASADDVELIPKTAFIHDPVIASVEVSPNGERIVALTLSDVNEPADITVWETADLSKPPRRFKPKDIKVLFVGWLNDDQLYAFGRQKYDYIVGGRTQKWFQDKAYVVDAEGKRFRQILKDVESVGTGLFNRLPTKPDKALFSVTNLEFAQDIYEVDLDSYLSKRIQRGATGENYSSDVFGNIRGRTETVGGGDNVRVEFSYVDPESESWDVHHALFATEREGLQPAGFDPDGRTVYMLDNTGRDKQVVRKYDLVSRELSDPIFADASIEATGVLQSGRPEELGKLIGFSGMSDDILTVLSGRKLGEPPAAHRFGTARRHAQLDLVVLGRFHGPRHLVHGGASSDVVLPPDQRYPARRIGQQLSLPHAGQDGGRAVRHL